MPPFPKTPIHGLLILDKPLGMTSSQAVGAVKRILRPTKIGHGGTLDPLATGILPLALGEATKLLQYVMDSSKSYRFTLRWGEGRDTDDTEGQVTASSPVRPSQEAILAALPAFLGDIQQTPPIYSAIKVDGKRSYALARAGEAVTLSPRTVHVDSLRLLAMPDPDHAEFEMDCGKGTYVRAIARDLAEKLGTCAHITALRRTRTGKFDETHAISLDSLRDLVHSAALESLVLPLESALDDIPAIRLDSRQSAELRQGRAVRISLSQWPGEQEITVAALSSGSLVAMCRFTAGLLSPIRVFNY